EGLVANEAFFDLVHIVRNTVDEVNAQRWKEREIRDRQRVQTGGPLHEALKKIEGTLEKDLLIPRSIKLEVRDLLNKVRLEQNQEIARMEDELQMYRNLASLGISTAAFAHETEAIGFDLNLYLKELDEVIRSLASEAREKIMPSLHKVSGVGLRSSQLVDMF